MLPHAVGRESEYEVWLYPKADEWQDYRYVNYDDWEVLRGAELRRRDDDGPPANAVVCAVAEAPVPDGVGQRQDHRRGARH